MLQNKNSIVNELHKADKILIIMATLVTSPKAKSENIRPNNWKNGPPGGWPTWSLYADAMYSPQSQKLAVGSIVMQYTVVAIINTSDPTYVLYFLN